MAAEQPDRGPERRTCAAVTCPGCGQEFTPNRPGQRSCRPSCRAKASRDGRVNKYKQLRAGLDALFGLADGSE